MSSTLIPWVTRITVFSLSNPTMACSKIWTATELSTADNESSNKKMSDSL